VERVGAKGLGGRVFEDEECGLKSSFNCAKAYGGVPAASEIILFDNVYTLIWVIGGGKGWNGVRGCAFLCLCLMSEPLHEANSICKAKLSQKCAKRSRKKTHDFTVFWVV